MISFPSIFKNSPDYSTVSSRLQKSSNNLNRAIVKLPLYDRPVVQSASSSSVKEDTYVLDTGGLILTSKFLDFKFQF